jgi:hypothetical protein
VIDFALQVESQKAQKVVVFFVFFAVVFDFLDDAVHSEAVDVDLLQIRVGVGVGDGVVVVQRKRVEVQTRVHAVFVVVDVVVADAVEVLHVVDPAVRAVEQVFVVRRFLDAFDVFEVQFVFFAGDDEFESVFEGFRKDFVFIK